MNRRIALAIPATGLLFASLAKADNWGAAVLYPLNLPAGFTSSQTSGNAQAAAEGQVVGYGSNGNQQALLWTGSTATNINPTDISGITTSYAYGTNGTQQVGFGSGTGTSSNAHALLWNGSASSAVDLNPTNISGITNSYAYATTGTQQVGFGYGTGTSNNDHALLWSSTANSAVDLNPTNISGITNSFANNTDGTQQVGYGYGTGTSSNSHALLWNGTANTATDLNPTNLTGITSSSANGLSATQEVGYGIGTATGGNDQALLWTGSASSAINLNPTNLTNITSSTAYDTNGTDQVGYGFGTGTSGNTHALLWEGSASSAVDLQKVLPSSGTWVFSSAYTVDASNNAFGFAYGTYNGATALFAVEWSVVQPQNLTWNNTNGSGDGETWDTGNNQNWNNGTAPAVFNAGDNVTFNDNNDDDYYVELDTTVKPGSVTVNNSQDDYIIAGAGNISGTTSLVKSGTRTLTLDTVNTYTGGTTVSGGTLIASIAGALPNGATTITGGTLQLGQNTGLTQMTSLSISGNGTLDIYNNHLIINYGSGTDPIASVAAWIASGYANGAWTGPGIISTAAQSNSASYGIGYADAADAGNPAGLTAGQVEIMYTLLGDANLDGSVNSIDFAILASNFNKAVSGPSGWDQGDFNYDGSVNSIDFAALAANFNKGASQADLTALEAFASANGLLADVPEPASIGLLLVGSAGLLGRRRRTR